MSIRKPNQLNIVVLDNGAFHKAKCLVIPDNIILIFLPPYSPELNPAESVWRELKRPFCNKVFKDLDQLSDFLITIIQKLNTTIVKSICAFNYIFSGSFWTDI
jgi:transposase